MNKEIVSVSEDEGYPDQYSIMVPTIIHEIFDIERPRGMTKTEIIGSITKEEVNYDEDIINSLNMKDRNDDGTFRDTLFWYNDIEITNQDTGKEVE